MKVYTAKQAFEGIVSEGSEFGSMSFWNKSFLDGVYLHADKMNGDISDLFKEQPFESFEQLESSKLLKVEAVLLAGIAEELFDMFSLEPLPDWVTDERLSFDEPLYAHSTRNEELKKLFEENTPSYYKKRNLMFEKPICGFVAKYLNETLERISEAEAKPIMGLNN